MHANRRIVWLTLALPALLPAGKNAAAADRIAVERDVPYIDNGDFRHLADIYVPPGEGPFPGVLMIHGGAWTAGSKGHMAAHARTVAEAGYTVVAINYRLAPKHPFPAQLEDCRVALRWMRTQADKYKIDANRIAAYGYSAGGHLACLLATTGAENETESDDAAELSPHVRIQCVVAGGAPCDFRTVPRHARSLAFWLGGTRAEVPDVYRLASPAAFVTKDSPPVFFFHGENDTLVPSASPKLLEAALREHAIPSKFHVLPGKGHIGAFLDREAPQEAVKFLNEHFQQTTE